MWQKVAKFKGAEYFRKALYIAYLVQRGSSLKLFPLLLVWGKIPWISWTYRCSHTGGLLFSLGKESIIFTLHESTIFLLPNMPSVNQNSTDEWWLNMAGFLTGILIGRKSAFVPSRLSTLSVIHVDTYDQNSILCDGKKQWPEMNVMVMSVVTLQSVPGISMLDLIWRSSEFSSVGISFSSFLLVNRRDNSRKPRRNSHLNKYKSPHTLKF